MQLGLSLNKPPMLEHSNIKKQPILLRELQKALQGRRTRASRPSTDTQLSELNHCEAEMPTAG